MQRLQSVLFALALCAAPALAQAAPSVSVRLSSGVVKLGERVALTLSVEGTTAARVLSIPTVDGLEFGALSGPSRQQFTEIVNGRMTRRSSLEWSLSLTPKRVGDLEVPPIELEVEGRRVSTRPQSLRVVRDVSGAELGFLEVAATPSRVVEGQAFTVEVRFGWDASGFTNPDGGVYADLSLPWWNGLPGLIELEGPSISSPSEVNVNRRERVRAERIDDVVRDGRKYVGYRIVKRWLPTRAGAIELPESFLEFGVVREGFFRSERIKQYFVGPVEATIPVVPLPEANRPFDYSGAVGDITARASVDSRDVVVGDSIKLTVDWTGSANLEFFEAPDLARSDEFEGFRVYGTREEKRLDRRRVVYDLAALDETTAEIPPVPLVIFDPETMEYRTVRTEPIPIRVRELAGAVALDDGLPREERFGPDIDDIDTRPLSEARDPTSLVGDRALVWGFVVVPVLVLGLRRVVRARRGDPGAPRARRRRGARRRLQRALSRAATPDERLDAFEEFLAARTYRSREAWQGARAQELLPASAAAPVVDATLARLAAAAWGGAEPVPAAEVLAAADEALAGGL
ncbi:MAG: BatD family protein [Planctomycetota bacterium]